MRPWQQRIDTVTTPVAARELLDELTSFVVLDPACGCGNFLLSRLTERSQWALLGTLLSSHA